MKLRDLGEFGLIQRLTAIANRLGVAATPENAAFPLLLPIGDDTAAWRTSGATELATTDTVVEGIHFTRETIPWEDLGWKVVVANISDIASMGGTPLYALVTLGLPPDTSLEDVEALYLGMAQVCKEHRTAIVGGDIVSSPTTFVTIALNGYLDGAPLVRSAARVGDTVAVTGFLGSARGGLEMMLNGEPVEPKAADYLRRAHRKPAPRVAAGHLLLREGVLAAMDISDGLVDDLGKMMAASGLAACVDSWRVPVHPLLDGAFPDRALRLALAGGEDYELLFTAPESIMERILAQLPDAVTIGSVVEGNAGQVTVRDKSGNQMQNMEAGWDHFRS